VRPAKDHQSESGSFQGGLHLAIVPGRQLRPVLPEASVQRDRLGFLQQLLLVQGQPFEASPDITVRMAWRQAPDAPAGFTGNCFGVSDFRAQRFSA
jgi:hypothetical protein